MIRMCRFPCLPLTFSDTLNNILPRVREDFQQPRHSSIRTKISARQIVHPITAPKQSLCLGTTFFQAACVPTRSSSTQLEVNRFSVHFSTHKMFLIIAAAAGGHNNPAVSSPWLSAVAQPTANSMGPRRMSRKRGTPQRGNSISNPSDLEEQHGGSGSKRV